MHADATEKITHSVILLIFLIHSFLDGSASMVTYPVITVSDRLSFLKHSSGPSLTGSWGRMMMK